MATKKNPQPRRRREERLTPAQQLTNQFKGILSEAMKEQAEFRKQLIDVLGSINNTLQRISDIQEGR